jgi:uncharacterized protein YfdQ (DUF2303 family)
MFDKATLTALQEGESISSAFKAISVCEDTKNMVALPSDYKLHDLEYYLPNRRRARGGMDTPNLASFSEYVTGTAEDGATVFIDQNAMTATAVLNLGTPDAPGHTDNTATLKPEKTAAYKALLQHANGSGLSQKVVAEFLEDWAVNCACFGSDAGSIKTAQAVAAVRKITIDSMRKIESEEQSLGASKSAFESVQASSKEPLPALIIFTCQPYGDLSPREFALRLGVLTGDAVPKVNLRISKFEEHQEKMAEELASKIEAQFDGGISVRVGTYRRGS